MGDGGTTLRAEDAVDSEAGGTLARPALGGALNSQLVLRDDSDEGYNKVNNCVSSGVFTQLTVGRASLTLAVIAVIIGSNQRCVNVHGVRDGFAEAVSGERHCVWILY